MSEKRPLNILLLGTQVPFTSGGAEALIARLARELKAVGHAVDLVQLPFSALPKKDLVQHMLAWRELKLEEFAGRRVDLVIPTKFPSYLVQHPCKVPWLVHQHRQLYELYGGRFSDFDTSVEDEAVRQMVYRADKTAFLECPRIYTIAKNVSNRLERFLQIGSKPLLPPLPLGDAYRAGEKGKYLLSVGRLCSIKRVDMVVRAMAQIHPSLELRIVGAPDEPAIEEYLKSEVVKHHLGSRVKFLGRVSDEDLVELYSNCFAVYYAPFDEDYGFVTLEARAAGKPVVTALDSGSVLDFITHEHNGLVGEPNESSIAKSVNELLEDEHLYQKLSFREDPSERTSSWEEIIESLTAPAYSGVTSASAVTHLMSRIVNEGG